MTLELHATPEEVMRSVWALQEFGEAHAIPDEITQALMVALEECGSNIVNHALKRDSDKIFEISFGIIGRELVITLRDGGPPFDPTKALVEATGDNEDRELGGWGIQLVRQSTDRVRYVREGDENVLQLFKKV